MDYLYVGPSKGRFKYRLVLVNTFLRMMDLVSTKSPTSIPATKAIVNWSSRYGLPDWIISDGESYFKNRVTKLLMKRLSIEHHITTVRVRVRIVLLSLCERIGGESHERNILGTTMFDLRATTESGRL